MTPLATTPRGSIAARTTAAATAAPPTNRGRRRAAWALAVLLPVALLQLAQGVIERRLHDALRTALDAAGDGWVTVTVAGQSATLGGHEPAPGRADTVLALAHGLSCPTWTGLRPCAARVEAAFMPAAVATSRATARAAAVPAATVR